MKCKNCDNSYLATVYGDMKGPCMVDENKKLIYAFQDGDDVHISLCLNCGQVVGNFPVNIIKNKKINDGEFFVEEFYRHIKTKW